MRLRLASMRESQFLQCVRNGLWGTEGRFLRKWTSDDMLAFIVEKEFAGLAKVSGKYFYSDQVVWSNGLYPHRIPIDFVCLLDTADRLPMQGPIRDAIMGAWGRQYGWGIVNKIELPEDVATMLVKEMSSRPNSLNVVRERLLAGTKGQGASGNARPGTLQ